MTTQNDQVIIGPSVSKLMIIGDNFDQFSSGDGSTGRPLAPAVAHVLDEMLQRCGTRLNHCLQTVVAPCVLPFDGSRYQLVKRNLESWRKPLFDLIEQIQPNAILALGDLALKAVTNENKIQNYRGSILQAKNGIKTIPTLHPRGLVYPNLAEGFASYSAKGYITLDIKRAVEESETSGVEIPQRLLQVCKGSHDLYRFFEQYTGKTKVSVDIEVVNCIPTCIAFAFNSYHAMSVPLLNLDPRLDPIADYEMEEIWRMIDNFWDTPGLQIIGQNFKFDHDKVETVMCMEVPNPWFDNMLASHTLYPELPQSQAFQTSIWTKEPYYKGEYKEYNPNKDNMNRIYLYNAKDAAVAFEVHESLITELAEAEMTEFFFDYVMHLHPLYRKIENLGLRIDEDRRSILRAKYMDMLAAQQKELEDIIGHKINVNSNPAIGKLLYQELKFPKRKGAGEDVITALLANNAKTPEKKKVLTRVLSIRQLNKTIGTYINFLEDEDGRARTSVRITGTETGRSSNSILKSPIRPTVYIKQKGQPKKKKGIGLAFQTMTKHGDIGSDIRSMFIPDEGKVFLNVDLSQAEARIVAILAKDEYLLDCFKRGVDIHRITASWTFISPTCSEEDAFRLIPKKTPEGNEDPRRFIGKMTRHAGGYDMRKKLFSRKVNNDARKYNIPVTISEWKADQILKVFHDKSPNIRGVFHEEVVSSLENDNRFLINPYGRKRQFLDRWDGPLFREAYAYLPQSTVGDKMKTSTLKFDAEYGNGKSSAEILIEAHDALLLQVLPDEANDIAKGLKKYLEEPIDFSRCSLSRGELIIPCDFEMGDNYKDLEKYVIR